MSVPRCLFPIDAKARVQNLRCRADGEVQSRAYGRLFYIFLAKTYFADVNKRGERQVDRERKFLRRGFAYAKLIDVSPNVNGSLLVCCRRRTNRRGCFNYSAARKRDVASDVCNGACGYWNSLREFRH